MRSAVALLLDVLLVLATGVILFILLTGGGTYLVGHTRIGLRSPDNAIVLAAILLLARYAMREVAPFLGVRRWPVTRVVGTCDRLLQALPGWAQASSERTARRVVFALIASCLVIKIGYATVSPGFYSGDDLEIHEMTLGLLLHQPWPIWDLRSPIFPIGFIYPAQRAAYALGIRDVTLLVIAGRLVVAVVSSVAVWLVWLAGRRIWLASRRCHVLACEATDRPGPGADAGRRVPARTDRGWRVGTRHHAVDREPSGSRGARGRQIHSGVDG